MELVKATYIACMLCAHVLRRAGTLTFDEKLHIIECISFLVSSLALDDIRCSMYSCAARPMLVYTAE